MNNKLTLTCGNALCAKRFETIYGTKAYCSDKCKQSAKNKRVWERMKERREVSK